MKPVGLVLSGGGVYDGCETHENVLTLLALERADAEALDAENKVVTTPGNILANSLTDLAKGIDKAMLRVLALCE